MLEPLGIRGHNARLADSSPAEMERAYVRLKADYAILKDYDSSNYTGQDRLSYEILEYFIGTQMRGALLPEYSSPGGLRWRERQ